MTQDTDPKPEKSWLGEMLDLAEQVVSGTESVLGATYLPPDKGGHPHAERHALPVIDAESEITPRPTPSPKTLTSPMGESPRPIELEPLFSPSDFIKNVGGVKAYAYALEILTILRDGV